jgi:hypothetical protein
VGVGVGGCNTPNNSNVGQSWSKWNWYLPKVGQNGTDICLKLKVKLGKIWSIKVLDKRCSKLLKVMKWLAILTILKPKWN